MTDPRYIDDDGRDENEVAETPMGHEAGAAFDAELARRYGDLRAHAAHIAGFFPGNDKSALTPDEVHGLLIKVIPKAYSAEADFARRWWHTARAVEQGGKRPDRKNGPVSDVRDHNDDRLKKYRPNELSKDLWSHLFFEGRGSNKPPLYLEQKDAAGWRPMSRDVLRAITPDLISFAKAHGFPANQLSTEFRRQDQDGRDNSGDDSKDIMELTKMKRLCLLVSQAIWPFYKAEDWFR